MHGAGPTLTLGAGPVGGASFHLAPLAAPFIALLGLVAVAIALYSPRYHDPAPGTAAYLLVYNLALLASLAVLIAGNVVAFLVAWETMALLCYLADPAPPHPPRGRPRARSCSSRSARSAS